MVCSSLCVELEIWIFLRKLVGCTFCYSLLMVHSFFIFCTNHKKKIRKLCEHLNTSSSIRTSDILNHSEVDRKWSGTRTVATSVQYAVYFRILPQAKNHFRNRTLYSGDVILGRLNSDFVISYFLFYCNNRQTVELKPSKNISKSTQIRYYFFIKKIICIKLNVARIAQGCLR